MLLTFTRTTTLLRRCTRPISSTIRTTSSSSDTSDTSTTKPKGFFKRLFDDTAKKERQKQLNAELEDGVFPQFKEFRKTSGKLFRADEELIGRAVAPLFPTIQVQNLLGEQTAVPPLHGKACLVGIAYNQSALVSFEAWRTAYLNCFGKEAPLLECTITESSFLSMFSSSVTTSLKNTVPEEHHRCHVPIFDQADNARLKKSLLITNTLPLYVFLVSNSIVRWRGTGVAEEEELEWMNKCAAELNEPGRDAIDSSIPRWQQVGTNNK